MKTYTAGPCDTCGYTAGPSKTPALAAHGQRMHSCAKNLDKAAKRQRGLDRDAAVDRTPKPCTHKQANHQHGTHACYVLDRCRCRPCARANADYEKHRARRHAYGRFDTYTDAQPVREHVQAWDDDTIDDPAAVPDTGDQGRRVNGRPAEHVAEDVAFLLEQDPVATADQIAHRLGYADRTGVQNALAPDRANRPDLLAQLARNAELAGHSGGRRVA